MRKATLIITGFIALTAFTLQNAWKSDKFHSELGFSIVHLGISEVSGTFNDFEVIINAEKEDFSDAVVELKAHVASINTRVTPRDEHLRSADFFDVEKYPSLHFKSTGIKKTGENRYVLTGNLTIKDITKPVSMDMIYNGSVVNPNSHAKTAGFQVSGSIKRSDFGVGAGFPEPMLSDEVKIVANGEFVQ